MSNRTYPANETRIAFESVLTEARQAKRQYEELCQRITEAEKNQWADTYHELREQAQALIWHKYILSWIERHDSDYEIVIGFDWGASKEQKFPDFLWCAKNESGEVLINGGLINHGSDSEPRYQSHT